MFVEVYAKKIELLSCVTELSNVRVSRMENKNVAVMFLLNCK